MLIALFLRLAREQDNFIPSPILLSFGLPNNLTIPPLRYLQHFLDRTDGFLLYLFVDKDFRKSYFKQCKVSPSCSSA